MEGQTLIFTNSAFAPPPTPFYASYNTPPYTLNYGTWPEVVYQPLSMNEDVLQMQQQLRFPTPPITPPRAEQTGPQTVQEPQQQQQPQSSEAQQKTPQRTQSVIMKVGHDQSPQHISADLPYVSLSEENKLTNHHHHHQHDHHHQQQQHQQHNDTPSSGTSSPTSHNDFICDWIDCGRYFESLELLAHHVTLIHAVASLTDGLYYCRWTGCQRTERGFNARYKMLVHVRTHTKEKPHQCHLCDKRFSRAENLKIHIRSHSGEKPYICTFEGCNKAYSNSSDRFKHTRTHSMEKPYMCKVPGCLKRYTDPSSLRKHVKTFKHSVQIMDSKATVHHPVTLNNIEESRYSLLEQNHKYPSYLVMPAAPLATTTQDSFCMAMEEMCHIKATLNCYSTNSTPVDTESYWLQESETDTTPSPLYHLTYHHNHHPTTYQHGSDYADVELDLTTDKPLDLRVNRC